MVESPSFQVQTIDLGHNVPLETKVKVRKLSGFCVAKVVKTIGCIAETTETLDEFRYKMLQNGSETGQ